MLVEGKIEKRTWDKDDGTKGYATEIVAETFNICKSADPNRAARQDNLDASDVEEVFDREEPKAKPKSRPRADEEISIEDIPF